jgi:presenilin-like A22 family membrane protease
MVVALLAWLTKNEERGLNFAVGGFLLSLVALQSLYFYLSQFSAITATLLQLAILQILFAYRRWYISNSRKTTSPITTSITKSGDDTSPH